MKSQIVLLAMVLFSTVILKANVLQKQFIPGEKVRLQVVSIENNTDNLEFQVYPSEKSVSGLVLPMSTLHLSINNKNSAINLSGRKYLAIKCSKGSYLPVFIKDGIKTSGSVPDGYEGPYSVSMWMPYQHVSDAQKLNIRYAVKAGKVGKIGVKIGSRGDYSLVALEDVTFIH